MTGNRRIKEALWIAINRLVEAEKGVAEDMHLPLDTRIQRTDERRAHVDGLLDEALGTES